jgi:polyhydroxyalkanoate synthesis repressor PhaR
MALREEPAAATTIKKYANRRLYDTGRSAYVTFDDLATMIREGRDVVVRDAQGTDITRSVLTQVLLDRGYSEEDIHKIMSGNILRVMRAAEAESLRLRRQ